MEMTLIDTKSSKKYIIEWRCFARQVCSIANENNVKKIGGPGHFIAIDETHLFRRKHNRGHRIKGESVWVLGGVDRNTKERFLCRVNNRKKRTMWPILKRFVAPQSIVLTDDHKSYKGIDSYLGLDAHEVVVHKYGFNNPMFPDIYTNTIESIWRPLKILAKRSGTDETIDLYIHEFLYRSKLHLKFGKRNFGAKCLHFMDDVRKVYPGPNKVIYKR
ncbi:unnamed protein product [Allacma fusca]|uniref:ISXO2-like transposase domain-containing protein n=1 Tax=Allacma fusca TaxID=39272 RepID=A0A8J2PS29_9HEXA|nr:unnamed protein product [Allacma fusca]